MPPKGDIGKATLSKALPKKPVVAKILKVKSPKPAPMLGRNKYEK